MQQDNIVPAISTASHNTSPPQTAIINQDTLNNRSVESIRTESGAERYAQREEPQQGQGVLARLGALVARVGNWFATLLGLNKSAPQTAYVVKTDDKISIADESVLRNAHQHGLIEARQLCDITLDADQIISDSFSKITATLNAVAQSTKIDAVRNLALILSQHAIGGHSITEWANNKEQVDRWLVRAENSGLDEAPDQLKALSDMIDGLRGAVDSELKGYNERASVEAVKATYSQFDSDTSPNLAIAKLKSITEILLAGKTVEGISRSNQNGYFEAHYAKMHMVKDTLIDVPLKGAKSTHYNANHVLDKTAIASHAPLKGQNLQQFADMLANENVKLIVDLTTETDTNFKYAKKYTNDIFTPGQSKDGFTDLTVKTSSGDIKHIAYINPGFKDHSTGDLKEIHEAVILIKDKFGDNGVVEVHCKAGVGRTALFLGYMNLYEASKNDTLDKFNYAQIAAQTVIQLRTERTPQMFEKKQVQALFEYGKYLADTKYANEQTASETPAIYENAPQPNALYQNL